MVFDREILLTKAAAQMFLTLYRSELRATKSSKIKKHFDRIKAQEDLAIEKINWADELVELSELTYLKASRKRQIEQGCHYTDLVTTFRAKFDSHNLF